MAKHELWELQQMQSMPLYAKIRMTESRVRGWYDEFQGNVYVSRSGGKDSDVLGDIVKNLYPDVPQVFVNTGLEFDSVRIHGTEVADVVLRPEMSFVEVITKYGYPIISKEVSLKIQETRRCPNGYASKSFNGQRSEQFDLSKYKFLLNAPFRISHKCCDVMKKNPSKSYEKQSGNKPFIGTMADESRLRKQKWLEFGCNAFDKKRPTSQPLSFWTEQDILQYIKQNDLKIAEVYGDIVYTDKDGFYYDEPLFMNDMKLTTTGAKRTGCVFCMFGITQDPERYLVLKKEEPKKYDYVMRGGKFDDEGMWIPHNGLGYKFVIG